MKRPLPNCQRRDQSDFFSIATRERRVFPLVRGEPFLIEKRRVSRQSACSDAGLRAASQQPTTSKHYEKTTK
jgi:hypothetical protein